MPPYHSLLDPALSLAADILDDLERVRTANANRLGALTRDTPDKDGLIRGFGLPLDHPDVTRLQALVTTLKCARSSPGPDGCCLEHDAEKNLTRKLKAHPLGAWIKKTKGIGEKQGARLLAAIGDPYIRPELLNEDGTVRSPEGPRTVSALWAYCGLHVLPIGHHTLDDQSKDVDGASSSASHQAPDAQARNAGGPPSPTGHADLGAHQLAASGAQLGDTGRGVHDTQLGDAGVAARRRKGQRANWSSNAKMRAYLIAESCVKQLSTDCRDGHGTGDTQCSTTVAANNPGDRSGPEAQPTLVAPSSGDQHVGDTQMNVVTCACSPYRVVYDRRRAHTAVTRPDWTDGHSHNDALRVASKEILKDLWRAARDWHLNQAASAEEKRA
jgi:hypothetical protein